MTDVARLRSSILPRFAAIALAFGALACARGAGDAGDPSIRLVRVDSLVLVPGQETRVDQLRLTFLRVRDDARCPIDWYCVWQGNAVVEITLAVGADPDETVILNTAYGSAPVEHAGYRVALLSLMPIPRGGMTVPAEEYRAAVRVEALRASNP